MVRKIFFLSLFSLALVILPLSAEAYYYDTPSSGVNYVHVTSCQQVGEHIRISRNNGPSYMLTSTIRDAGHGLRDYTLNCVGSTQYRVEWTNVIQPSDTILPNVSISSPQMTYTSGTVFGVAVTASDNVGVARIDLYRDGMFVDSILNQSQLNYSQLASYSNVTSTHTFYARVYDAAGNTRQSNSITIYITPSAATILNIGMTDSQYVPRNIVVKAGTTIVWTNNGSLHHTVTADAGTFTSGILLPGQTYSRTFNTVGTYPYYCVFHGAPAGVGMSGTVTVIY